MMKWKKRNKYFTVGLVCKSAGMSFPSYTFCIFFLPVILHYQSSPQMSSIGRHKIIKLGCNPIGRLFIFVGLSSSEISQYFLRSLPGSRSHCTTVMVVKKYHDGSSNIINCSMLINESYNMSSLREL